MVRILTVFLFGVAGILATTNFLQYKNLDTSVLRQYNVSTMLVQKLYKNGNSVAVTIPKELLNELHLRDGSEVVVSKDESRDAIVIEPKKKEVKKNDSSLTPKFIKWLEDFNKEYGPALKELAKK